jgi:hypothetical protein
MGKQIVVSGNRVLAHGEDCFISMGGTVICPDTGKRYQNATVVECETPIPVDVDSVGYEYRAGVFVPCAPYGKTTHGNVMLSCNECGTPRSSDLVSEDGGLYVPGILSGCKMPADVSALFGVESAELSEVMARIAASFATSAKAAIGSYTGTGTYGNSNPNVLSFNGKPIFGVVLREASAVSDDMVLIYAGQPGTTGSGKVLFSNPTENELSWYSTTAEKQFNFNKSVYHYVFVIL